MASIVLNAADAIQNVLVLDVGIAQAGITPDYSTYLVRLPLKNSPEGPEVRILTLHLS